MSLALGASAPVCYRFSHESAPSGRSNRARARTDRKAISYQFTISVVADIPFYQQVACTFIRVDCPPAVVVHSDVMDQIISEHCAGLFAERIDSAHIVQEPGSEMMDMVLGDQIVTSCIRAVAPDPAGRYAAVFQVMDMIVDDVIRVGVDEDNADGAGEHLAAVRYLVV